MSDVRAIVESLSPPLRAALKEIAKRGDNGAEPDPSKARARGALRKKGLVYSTRPPAVMWLLDPNLEDEICEALGVRHG